ncbi:hypothetical protein ACFQE1_07215 [Halobium palmae]|uniref:Uncharacterized protein n=1 Tax=Halobium palmae TaxID=1776492 RepID=A0ABD5RYA9_9EURY
MSPLALSVPVLQAGLLSTPLGQLLAALVVAAVVLLVGRVFLKLAWRIVTFGIVLVAEALALSMLGIDLGIWF